MSTSRTVAVEFLLAPGKRGPSMASQTAERLKSLGFDVGGVGEATITASLSGADFERIFGQAPAPRPPPDAKAYTAWNGPPALRVPSELDDCVQSVTEAPRHLRF